MPVLALRTMLVGFREEEATMCPFGPTRHPSNRRVACERTIYGSKGTLLMAASEFQRTLMSYLSRQGMSVAGLAGQTGYSPVLLENLLAGKTPPIPGDFFLRVAGCL